MVQVKIVGLQALRARINGIGKKLPTISLTIHTHLSNAWRAAAAEFVKAAVQEVLVETGMSAATFFPLARLVKRGSVGQVRTFIRSHGPIGARRDRPEFPGGRRASPPRIRSIKEGEREGERAFTLTFGSHRRPVFAFSFSTVVFQFAFHEESQSALPEGELAFRETVQRLFVSRVEFFLRQFFRTGRILLVLPENLG